MQADVGGFLEADVHVIRGLEFGVHTLPDKHGT